MPTNKKYVQRSATITLPNGSKKRLKANGNTEREADIKLAQLVALYNAGLVLPTAKTTFAAYAGQYIQTFQVPCLAPRTVEKNQRFLDKHILPYIGQIELGSLTASSIQQCLNLLQNKYARDSIKKIFQIIFKILEHAKTDRLIQYNPAQGVSHPAVNRPPASVSAYLTPSNPLPQHFPTPPVLRRLWGFFLFWSSFYHRLASFSFAPAQTLWVHPPPRFLAATFRQCLPKVNTYWLANLTKKWSPPSG